MIKEDEVFSIGKVTRSRGLVGEVELYFTDDAFDRGESEYVFLSLDGILVPFFWEEYKYKNDNTLIVKFEGIDNSDQAQKIIGATAYYPFAALSEEEEKELTSLRALVGYTLFDESDNRIGRIVEVNDHSANVLLYIEREDGGEVILPYHDDFLVSYDLGKHTLNMAFPAGLLELNA